MPYPIFINREIRRKTEYILIVHAPDFVAVNHPVEGDLAKGSRRYTWNDWQTYLTTWGDKTKLPMHYFMELVDNDWSVMKGLGETRPSYYLQELVANGVLSPNYQNSIVIMVAEDFDLHNPSKRFYEILAEKLLVPLMKLYHLDWSRIVYFDECMTDLYFDNLGKEKPFVENRFEYKPMSAFDATRLLNEVDKFNR